MNVRGAGGAVAGEPWLGSPLYYASLPEWAIAPPSAAVAEPTKQCGCEASRRRPHDPRHCVAGPNSATENATANTVVGIMGTHDLRALYVAGRPSEAAHPLAPPTALPRPRPGSGPGQARGGAGCTPGCGAGGRITPSGRTSRLRLWQRRAARPVSRSVPSSPPSFRPSTGTGGTRPAVSAVRSGRSAARRREAG